MFIRDPLNNFRNKLDDLFEKSFYSPKIIIPPRDHRT